ncbi:MAG TPA: recombination mediator RecR [Candidatus Woesebacteria bacterium]|nr:recombination mediator RecR [Candidatus Woesebacteria bacterium]HPJ17198.1 recombination mediator RecR [Candidatus Woesebacteria bacterium]
MKLPQALTDLIESFEKLPGIGPKSASRIGFYLLNTPEEYLAGFAKNLVKIKSEVKRCSRCHGVSDNGLCSVCADGSRNQKQICVVERAVDMISMEKMGNYKGIYHILGGALNPLDHIGPDDLKIDELVGRVSGDMEIILATNPTIEGEATALYIKRRLESLNLENIKITRIGSGLPMGADLEFADEATLSRAMEGRRAL